MRRFEIYTADSYDDLPPASWGPGGKLIVYGQLNPAEMGGNSIDGVTVPFNTTNIKSALLFFDTASLQVIDVKPVYRINNGVQTGITAESYAVAEDGRYYASYSEFIPFPRTYQGNPYDLLKPKSFILAFSSSGNLLWTKQGEGLQPMRMIELNGELKIIGSNYVLNGFTNGSQPGFDNQSRTYSWVRKLTAVTDPGGQEGTGAYGTGSLDIILATLRPTDGTLTKILHLGSAHEDENVLMIKGYGDQLWVSGTVGSQIRTVLNVIDTSSTLTTYKIPVNNSCTASYQSLPAFLALDIHRNNRYCVDSIFKIYWSSALINQVSLFYSTNNGTSYTLIATDVAATKGVFDFNILNAGLSGNLLFRIEGQGSLLVDTVSVFIYPKINNPITISTASTSVCNGASVTFTATPGNAGTASSYQWYLNNIPTGVTGATYTSTFNNNDKIQVKMTVNTACMSSVVVSSNAITLTVNSSLPVSITIAGTTTVNPGQSVQLTSTMVNGGSSAGFQWEDSTQAHSWQPITNASSGTLTYFPAATGDRVRCKLSGSINCATPATAFSNTLIFTVNVATAVSTIPGSSYGIHLYPNPVRGIFYLDTLKLSDNWDLLEIVSIDGKNKLLSYKIKNQYKLTVDASKLSSGIYLAILRRKTGRQVYLKFIKL